MTTATKRSIASKANLEHVRFRVDRGGGAMSQQILSDGTHNEDGCITAGGTLLSCHTLAEAL
jgi:hypothetical protein